MLIRQNNTTVFCSSLFFPHLYSLLAFSSVLLLFFYFSSLLLLQYLSHFLLTSLPFCAFFCVALLSPVVFTYLSWCFSLYSFHSVSVFLIIIFFPMAHLIILLAKQQYHKSFGQEDQASKLLHVLECFCSCSATALVSSYLHSFIANRKKRNRKGKK